MHCPVTGIHLPRYIATIVASFVFIYAFEFVWHGILMMPMYEATADLWRPHESMAEFFPYILVAQLGYAILFSFAYAKFIRSKCPVHSVAFGICVGGILGVSIFGSYAYYPLPAIDIPLYWLAGAIVQGAALGLISWLIYRDAGKGCCHTSKEEKDESAKE